MKLLVEIEVPDAIEHSFELGFEQEKRGIFVLVSEGGLVKLGVDVVLVKDGLKVLAASLVTFVEGRELHGKPDPELEETLFDIAKHLRV